MKKIALAAVASVLGLSAFAQSSVTLYGRVNTTFENQKDGTAGRVNALNNNASRWGVRVNEDLGGGMFAKAVLEAGFSADTGMSDSTAYFGRQSSVEVGSASMGSVRMGNWLPGSYLATADYISMHNHDTGRSSDALYAFGAAFPRNNKIGYFTPNWGGFSGEASVSLGEGKAANARDLSANYVAGSVHLGAGYSAQGGGSQAAVRGLYFMGPVALGAYLQRESIDGSAFGKTRNIGRLSAMYGAGASEFHVNGGTTQKGGTQGDKASQWTLGYNYNLSKRTKVYTYYTVVKGQSDATSSNSFAVGVRHNF